MIRRAIVVAGIAVAVTGCGGGGGGDDAAVPAPGAARVATTTTAPSAEGISASVEQGRPFVARELLEVLLRNGSDGRLEVRSLRLLDPRFAPVEPTLRDVLLLGGHGPTSMPIAYGDPRCDVGGDAGAPMVELVRVDGSTLLVPVDVSGDDFLGQLHALECQRARIGEVVSLRWGPPFTAVSDAVVGLVLHVERVGGDDAVTIHDLGGTVVFAQRLVDPGSVPATLGPGERSLEIAVELSTERCEAHALTESNKTYRFQVWVSVGEDPSQLLEVVAEGDARARLDAAMQAGCFGTLD